MKNKVHLLVKNQNLLKDLDSIYGPYEDKVLSSFSPMVSLVEFAGRICYNSGRPNSKNRPTVEYFKHIIESKHYSIFGHWMKFFRIKNMKNFLNYISVHKRTYLRQDPNENFYVILSLRHLIEDLENDTISEVTRDLALAYKEFGIEAKYNKLLEIIPDKYSVIEPYNFLENIYSFFIQTSRRTSLELLRHNTEYCVSQESTRYVSKGESKLVNEAMPIKLNPLDKILLNIVHNLSLYAYNHILNSYKTKDLLEKKTLRGFLSGYLLQDTDTVLVYTCTEYQFNCIKEQRLSQYADPNIRDLVEKMSKEVEKYGNA